MRYFKDKIKGLWSYNTPCGCTHKMFAFDTEYKCEKLSKFLKGDGLIDVVLDEAEEGRANRPTVFFL